MTEEQDMEAVVASFKEGLYKNYTNAFGKLFASCMYSLPTETELRAQAYKINKPELIIRACREILEAYEKGLEESRLNEKGDK